MKAYAFEIGHVSYEEGYVVDRIMYFTTKREAEFAEVWAKSLPDDPVDTTVYKYKVYEIEIAETFQPWLSEERVAQMRKEVDEYWEEVEARERQHEYEEEQYLRYLDECEDAVNPGD